MTDEQVKKESKVICPVKIWPMRLRASLVVLFLTFLVAALIVILKDDLVNKKIDELENQLLDYVGERAFALESVTVKGRQKTKLADITDVLDVKRGDNLLKLDVRKVKQQLESLPWVRDVDVVRSFFPNSLRIEIKEKQVMAIWQLNERFYPLDMDGYVIEADYRPDKPILLVVGASAPENILSLLKMVKETDEKFLPRIKVANFISKRRWNVILDDIRTGVTIKLPEDGVEKAWKKLLKLEETKGILKRKLTIIDLRLDGKVTVKLRKSKMRKNKSEQEI